MKIGYFINNLFLSIMLYFLCAARHAGITWVLRCAITVDNVLVVSRETHDNIYIIRNQLVSYAVNV